VKSLNRPGGHARVSGGEETAFDSLLLQSAFPRLNTSAAKMYWSSALFHLPLRLRTARMNFGHALRLPSCVWRGRTLPCLFISHSNKDDLAAEAIRVHLIERGWTARKSF
jgi:hypothetical protein